MSPFLNSRWWRQWCVSRSRRNRLRRKCAARTTQHTRCFWIRTRCTTARCPPSDPGTSASRRCSTPSALCAWPTALPSSATTNLTSRSSRSRRPSTTSRPPPRRHRTATRSSRRACWTPRRGWRSARACWTSARPSWCSARRGWTLARRRWRGASAALPRLSCLPRVWSPTRRHVDLRASSPGCANSDRDERSVTSRPVSTVHTVQNHEVLNQSWCTFRTRHRVNIFFSTWILLIFETESIETSFYLYCFE